MRTIESRLEGAGLRIAVIVSRFNHPITHRLLEGCLGRLQELGCEEVDVAWVPGAFEIPIAVRQAARSRRYHALVALGAVIRGDTPHFDYVCQGVTSGLGRVSLDSGCPVGFGVLTTDSAEQALRRAAAPGEAGTNKGAEAAGAAVEMACLLASLEGSP